MTILSTTDDKYILTAKAVVVEDTRDLASTWASKYITNNNALKWIIGNYVEADKANSNGQYWSLEDLRLKSATVNHGPMNIGHQDNAIIGTYVGSEMIYPTSAELNPYIETVGAMWKYYFPEEVQDVQKAFAEGNLYQSMECIADSVTCVGDAGCGQTFDYTGPWGDYCEHLNEGSAARQLNDPHFLGGGIIIPPMRPGWRGAAINDVSKIMDSVDTGGVYDQVAEDNPDGTPAQWESLMQTIVLSSVAKSQDHKKAALAGRLIGEQHAITFNNKR